ncbi:DUF885 family protein [Sandaracinobacter neustonicus]|uniref:DUF885 family protein n=1 Tax=Sandaracinobacter neustonicus TaxID=1715348 RepID=A0A501XXF3_9SPHN|nr:DUF885 family protein [Sandaracinobacter neustonicus]TPE64784.1 DUF885 family protein [Sandaracinobacter neustonicus]
MQPVARRQLLLSGGALAAAQLVPGALRAAAPADEAAGQRLGGVAEALLAEYPENASALGLDTGVRAALKSRLTDRTPAGVQALAAAARQRLAQLRSVDSSRLGPDARTHVAVTAAAHALAVEGFDFGFGDTVMLNQLWSYRNAPYVVAQNMGAFVEIPDFLENSHSVSNAADADAYLARMEAYAAALDGETVRLAQDRGKGVVAPDFLLDKTLRQMKAARAQPVGEWGVVGTLARRTGDIPGDYAARATKLAADRIAPALDRQLAELARHRAVATSDAGVWKLPKGDAYYDWALRAATTSTLTPEQVHQLGLEQVKTLHAQMDGLLRAQGLTQGTVGERMTALGKDPKHLFPNTDAGRAQILDYLNGRITDIRGRMPRAFATLVPGNLVVKRVPPDIEAGAPGGSATAGTMDGTVPGIFFINLRDTATNPRFGLPTLAYHEGIPGHVWQGEYSYKLPLIRSLLAFNAYSEGWALYAEQLADELDVYDGDPFGRLGYLQSIAFRACRLVVDTGLHAKRWTREQAIHWFASTNGSPIEEVSSEVDRYCAWPGQACGYKAGHNEINRLRRKAQSALGSRYDQRLFNDAVVKAGGVPMTVLEQLVDAHIAGVRG